MIATCGDCPHLKRDSLSTFYIYSCGKTGSVVPQITDDKKAVFSRVPLHCPLPDSEVVKSNTPAPRKTWVRLLNNNPLREGVLMTVNEA